MDDLVAFLINLPRSTKRRLVMEERLDALGLPYTLVPGIDGRAEWDRRAGAMLSLLGADPGSDVLREHLEAQKDRVRQESDLPPLPLFNGLPATTLLPEWGILAP